MSSVMRKCRSFGKTNLKYGIFSETRERKNDGKFPIKKFQSADFDRVDRVRGNKVIFNFGLIYQVNMLSQHCCRFPVCI